MQVERLLFNDPLAYNGHNNITETYKTVLYFLIPIANFTQTINI